MSTSLRLRAGTLHKIVPAGEHGAARVVHDTPSDFERLRASWDGMPLYAQKYTRLFIGNEVWMTDAEFECYSNQKIVIRAYGDVLVAGLGLGLILGPMLAMEDISSVTVLEKSPDVIALVGPWYQSEKLTIIEANVHEWTPPKKAYNFVYFDIWPNVPNSDQRAEISTLKKRYRSSLKPGGRTAAWCEERTQR